MLLSPNFNPRSLTGATLAHIFCNIFAVFQSTHPYGCDLDWQRVYEGQYTFQSTHPYGCDFSARRAQTCNAISIHAPLRVRLYITLPRAMQRVFQSTHPYGCDKRVTTAESGVSEFQSTHPYGCDRAYNFHAVRRHDFNPRTLTGTTNVQVSWVITPVISIHAPLRVRHSLYL